MFQPLDPDPYFPDGKKREVDDPTNEVIREF
jgi:hypothetical protein